MNRHLFYVIIQTTSNDIDRRKKGERNMFDNIGGKIKTLAEVVCALGIIASVLAAFVVWGQGDYYGTDSTILLGVLIIGLGSLGSWLGGFFTYGFGQLIDSVEEIRKNHEAMQKRLESFENNLQRKEKVYKQPNTLPVEEEKKEYTEPLICADEMDGDESLPDTIVCPVCGKIQEAGNDVCQNCGAKFTKWSKSHRGR